MVKLKTFPKFILLGVMFEIEITVSVLSIVVRVGTGTWTARTFWSYYWLCYQNDSIQRLYSFLNALSVNHGPYWINRELSWQSFFPFFCITAFITILSTSRTAPLIVIIFMWVSSDSTALSTHFQFLESSAVPSSAVHLLSAAVPSSAAASCPLLNHECATCVALFKIECSENFSVAEKFPFLGQNVKMKIDVSELGPGPKIAS